MELRLPAGTFNTNYRKDMAIVRTKMHWSFLAGFLIFVFTFPLYSPAYWLSLSILIGITLIAVLGLQILTGMCGQASLGQAAFMGVGAYVTAILTTKLGWSCWAALPCAGIAAALTGLIFGLSALRVKEFYLLVATIAAQFIFIWVVLRLTPLTGGSSGLYVPGAYLGNITFDTAQNYYYPTMILVIIMTFFTINLRRTKVGRIFFAIRDNDIAAQVMGINVSRYKLLAFFISCFYAGIAGWLWTYYFKFIHPDQFGLKESVWFLSMIIIGGTGSALGAVLGTILIKLLDIALVDYLSSLLSSTFPSLGAQTSYSLGLIIFALVLIICLIFEPRGLAHRWELIKNSYRYWPYSF